MSEKSIINTVIESFNDVKVTKIQPQINIKDSLKVVEKMFSNIHKQPHQPFVSLNNIPIKKILTTPDVKKHEQKMMKYLYCNKCGKIYKQKDPKTNQMVPLMWPADSQGKMIITCQKCQKKNKK